MIKNRTLAIICCLAMEMICAVTRQPFQTFAIFVAAWLIITALPEEK